MQAALQPIRGCEKLLRLMAALNAKLRRAPHIEWRMLNGLPALVFADVDATATRRYALHAAH